ncbi:TetR/AcrR family transcriptional regulator [Dietzia maris]|uniref:TetR/AcrR family transcriptional regulator n=1 Tax=Dietzia maris TaxID=37915 RepID=UPI003001FA7B
MTTRSADRAVDDRDLTAKARIRNAALDLFAENGPDAVSLRSVGAAAGVAHGLVVHHYQTKNGLQEAVEQYIIDRFAHALGEVPANLTAAEVARLRDAQVNEMLRAQPAIVDYMRRALLTPASNSSFADRLIELTVPRVRELRAASVASVAKPECVQVTELLVRYLGTLFLNPMVDKFWGSLERMELDVPAGSSEIDKPIIDVRIRRAANGAPST